MPTRDPLVRTKLYRPHLTPELVVRKRLLEMLDRAGEAPVTLVSAPAGYGKSVVISQWVEQGGLPTAWVSLDREDGELASFLAYVAAAVDTIVPGACRATAELLIAPELPPAATVGDHLCNDLDALESPCVLVLDDYHRIELSSPVHDVLNRLLAHPPRHARLVLVSRQDPPLAVARPRAANRLVEVRMQDLRFTEAETTVFLADTAQHAVGEAALKNLQHEVEGWAIGLRLVTLALRHAPDPDAFLCGMRGGLALTREYLLHEVLASLSARMRRFLLLSSILDRFCAELLEALDAGADGEGTPGRDGHDFLRGLQESNLFTIPLDARGKWFRYHHLFQELLVNELRHAEDPAVVADLHARASAWFEAGDLIDEALQHALASDDTARAVRLVENHRRSVVNDDRWYLLEKWLRLLPADEVAMRPELLMARGWYLLHHSRFEAVLLLAEQVESLLEDNPRHDEIRGEIALFRGYLLFFLGDGAGSLYHTDIALARIPVDFYEGRAQSEVIDALSKQMTGRREEALGDLDDLVARDASHDQLRLGRLLITLVFIHYLDGSPAASEAANRRTREVSARGGFVYMLAWVDYMQGLIHLQRGELEEAAECLARSVAQRFIHFKRTAVDSLVGLMLVQQALGEEEQAESALQKLRDYVAAMDDPVLWALVASAEARLAVMAGRPQTAATWLAAGEPAAAGAMIWWLEVPAVTRCRVQVAGDAPDQLAAAAERLEQLAAECEAHHNTNRLVGILALEAVVRERLDGRQAARIPLAKAVELALPGGLVFPFMEAGALLVAPLKELPTDADSAPFVARLVAACSAVAVRDGSGAAPADESAAAPTRSQTAAGVLDDLTERELDVLALLENRLQDKEVAARLDISVHTVRHHLKQIYQKLDVHGRRQAVRRGREIGLLGDAPSN